MPAAPKDAVEHESTRAHVLVIIPAYNEEKNIGYVLDELRDVRALHGLIDEVVVIDDCSTDMTGQVAASRGAHGIRHERNLGEEGGSQTGMRYALKKGYSFVVKMDADGQHNPRDVLALLRPLVKEGADMVWGSRRGHFREPWLFKLGRIFSSIIASVVLGKRIFDATSGFYGFSRRSMLLFRYVHETGLLLDNDLTNNIERLVLARRAGLKVVEVSVRMRPSRGPSKCYTPSGMLRFPFALVLSLVKSMLIRLPKELCRRRGRQVRT